MNDQTELQEEQRKMRLLRTVVDLTSIVLQRGNLTIPEAMELVQATRKGVLKLFPGKEDVYDLIYRPRFERIINERLEQN